MFRHILVPTDGSELSQKAIDGAIDLARAVSARVTAYACLPQYPYSPFSEVIIEPPADFRARSEREARAHLDEVEAAAQAAGVECDTWTSAHPSPYLGIIEAAERGGVRRDLHGVPRTPRARQPVDRQRDAARADPYENSGDRLSVGQRRPWPGGLHRRKRARRTKPARIVAGGPQAARPVARSVSRACRLLPDCCSGGRCGGVARRGRHRRHAWACYATFLPSKNCSSSVDPCSAVVDASRSTVCVTASK